MELETCDTDREVRIGCTLVWGYE